MLPDSKRQVESDIGSVTFRQGPDVLTDRSSLRGSVLRSGDSDGGDRGRDSEPSRKHDKDHRDHDDEDHSGGHSHDDDDDDDDGKSGGTGGYTGATATPFLLIKSSPNDVGGRPIALASAVDNQSIHWVGDQVAVTYQFSVDVTNLGAVACVAGLAEFYVVDIIYGTPQEFTATPSQIRASAQLVGYGNFSVPAGATVNVPCSRPWPATKETGVLVQVYDFFTDRLTSPFDVINDRHVARWDLAISG